MRAALAQELGGIGSVTLGELPDPVPAVGQVLVRASGSFDVVTATRRVGGISWRYCQQLQQGDGYTGLQDQRALPPQD